MLSLPTYLLAFNGGRITQTSLGASDAIGWTALSIGNMGPPAATAVIDLVTASTSGNGSMNSNVTAPIAEVRTILGIQGAFELPMRVTDASLVIAAADTLICLMFIGFIACVNCKIAHVEQLIGENNVTARSYAVMVRHLPRDVSKAEIRAHFDRLYNLRNPDWTFAGWCGCCFGKSVQRPIVPKPRRGTKVAHNVAPVLNATNTGDSSYLRSWVAEVSLAHPNGSLMRRYMGLTTRLEALRRARAAVKMFSANSPFRDDQRRAAATRTLAALEARMARLDARLSQRYSGEVVAAFVIFNNEESRRRAVFDYALSNNSCFRCLQPTPLRLHRRGSPPVPIEVQPAPEPSDILWEHLEATACERRLRQLGASGIMLILIAVSLVFIILAQQAQKQLSTSVPGSSTCLVDFPAAQLGRRVTSADSVVIGRIADLDGECTAAGSGAPRFGLAVFQQNDDGTRVLAPLVSGFNDSCYSNCVGLEDNAQCDSTLRAGVELRKAEMIGCFCTSRLREDFRRYSIPVAIQSTASDAMCGGFVSSYVVSSTLTAVAAVTVVLINFVLKNVAHMLTDCERHHTLGDAEQARVTKILILQWINTALIVLLVNARFELPGAPSWIQGLSGDFDGFVPRWYAVAGASITLTMVRARAADVMNRVAGGDLQCVAGDQHDRAELGDDLCVPVYRSMRRSH